MAKLGDMKKAHRAAKLELSGKAPRSNPKRKKSAANPRKKTTARKSSPRKKPRKMSSGKKAWKTRRRKYGKSGMASARSPRRSSNLPAKRKSNKATKRSNPRKRTKGYRYYKPSIGKYVTVPGRSRSNPSKRRKKRRSNPASYPTTGGFLPTFGRIKKQFYIFPGRKNLYPSFKDIKAHPILAGVGFLSGGASSLMWGGIGRALGGKNVLISEVLGVIGNVAGFEIPARIVSLFKFKGCSTMVKSMRAGGIIATVISTILGIARAVIVARKGGVSALKPKYPLFGQIKIPKLKELPKAAAKLMQRGAGLSDEVTSGFKQGYDDWQPYGVSDTYDPGYENVDDGLMDADPGTEWWQDGSLGEPWVVEKIKELQDSLGLSDAQVKAMWTDSASQMKEDELPGLGETYVPPDYEGGMSRDYAM